MAANTTRLVDRTVAVLSFLARKAAGASTAEIAAATGLSPATVYRILITLCDHKAAVRLAKGQYEIGPLVLSWAQAYRQKTGIARVADAFVERLWEETGETVNLFYLEGWQLYFIKRLQSPQPISTNCHVGGRLNLYSSSAGRAVLAAFPDRELDEYLKTTDIVPDTERTLVDPDGLRRKIMEARALGYGEENEENEPGIRCVGAAILDAHYRPVGAVSVTAPAFRLDDARVGELGPKIAETARSISREMGWNDGNQRGESE